MRMILCCVTETSQDADDLVLLLRLVGMQMILCCVTVKTGLLHLRDWRPDSSALQIPHQDVTLREIAETWFLELSG